MRRLFLDLPLVRCASTVPRPIRNLPGASHSLQHTGGRDKAQLFDRIKDTIIKKHTSHGIDVSGVQADVFNHLLIQINKALKDENLQSLYQHWLKLEQKELTRFLAPSHLRRVSEFAVSSLLSVPDAAQTIGSPQWKWLEDISVLAADAHQTDALKSCMMYHIKHNNPQAVLGLYDRCKSIMSGDDSWEDDPQELSRHYDVLALNPETLKTSVHIPGRVDLLLAVVTAHAMRNSFRDALDACLETVVRFHHYTTQEFYTLLDHDPALRSKVELYVRRLSVARLVSRPHSLSKQITNLVNSAAIGHLQNLYNSIIDGITGPDPYLAVDPTSLTTKRTVAVNEIGWTSFLSAFLACRRKDLAGKVWQDLPRLGLSHSVSMWTALIDGYAKSGPFRDALATWDAMLSSGVKPNFLTYRALISALFNGKRPQLAMDRFRRFQAELMKELPAEQVVLVMNTVLQGLLATNRADGALSLLMSMESGPYKPDIVSYNTFIAHYGRNQNLRGVGEIINRMVAAKIQGDIVTFSTVLSVLLKAGRQDGIDLVFRQMRRQGLEANVATYTAIIDRLLREQDETSLNGAIELLHRMETDSNGQPNAVTYTAIIAGIHRDSWLPSSKAQEWTRQVLGRMRKRNIKLSTPGYNILLDASLKNGQPEGVQYALSYYREMLRQKIPMNYHTWYVVLSGLVQRQEWDLAREVVNDMSMTGMQPMGSVLELAGKIYKQTNSRKRQRPGDG
ncbi:hypothetical protein VKT23_003282 [Stygiomarasmius scandens]|uniref:Pentatricopeptide repeat-containing protein n=1 Tax=Marasmiellus scandens TaxID=2682957 RepID=A0ABR1JWQ0_9AGAR